MKKDILDTMRLDEIESIIEFNQYAGNDMEESIDIFLKEIKEKMHKFVFCSEQERYEEYGIRDVAINFTIVEYLN